jgi:3-hydroxyacyl-CoA dehydrogenase
MSSINTVAVFGSGLMGSGIAQTIAQAGVKVTLADVSDKALQ